MEAFQLLSRGGARFNKQRFKSDVQLFTVGGRDGYPGPRSFSYTGLWL